MTFRHIKARDTLAKVGPADLDWYFDLHDKLKWTYAKTMPFAPHSYVWYGRNISEEDYDRAFGVIKAFGEPGNYYSRTQLYLHNRERDHRYWLMDRHFFTCYIINMSWDGVDYGEQIAPTTKTDIFSEYDEIGPWWDDVYREFDQFYEDKLFKLIHQNANLGRPSTLDLGAGTGGTNDSKVAPSEFTVAIDPSQAMLNDLVVKYPQIGAVYPETVEQYLSRGLRDRFDLVIASFGSASYLTPREISESAKLADGLFVYGFYKDRPSHREELPPTHDAALAAAKDLPGSVSMNIGNFIYVIGRGM